ncbi:MAG TPA: ATP-binding protein, partial [Gemmatimonadales bacterium]|nr:ATP-binding protein [Gemmatimonadales bacterium]
GRLAGGVAHDFNNLLTAMLGHADLVLAELPAGHPVRTDVEEIQRAGQRAASLTRQLLAFSRKQLLQPKVIDLNRTVGELQHMLCRLIPENIEVRLDLMPTPIHVCADPGQIQQVLLNLVVNARDAMEAGGILGIASGLAELTPELAPLYDVDDPGEYAYLAVSDTGKGMDEATRRRIFEPFFTTKPQGQGTGLGLATVYGIVRQSNGYIWVHSEPGGGSVFVVFLPRVAAPAASCGEPERRPERRGTEVVLLVEDEASVRLLAARLLRRAGYTVLEAADGAEALELVLSDPGPIDLVLTDVVMPRLGGPDLVDRLLAERPGLKVLFMSGYSERELRTDAIPASKVRLLLKPFTPDALVATVRGVLDA